MDLKTYGKNRGAFADLARAIGVSPVMVSQWSAGDKPVPAERCIAIEVATDGKVRCEELRPDLPWSALRGRDGAASAVVEAKVA